MTDSKFTVNFQVGWMWGFRETGVNDNSKVWGLRHWKDGVVINWVEKALRDVASIRRSVWGVLRSQCL